MPPSVVTDMADLPKPPPVSQPWSPDTPRVRGQKRAMMTAPSMPSDSAAATAATTDVDFATPSRRVSARRGALVTSPPATPATPAVSAAATASSPPPAAAAKVAEPSHEYDDARTSPPPGAVRPEAKESPAPLRTPTTAAAADADADGAPFSGASSLTSPEQRKIWMRPCNECGHPLHVRRTRCTECGSAQTSKRTILAMQEEVHRAEQREKEAAALAQLKEAQKEEAQAAASQLALIFEAGASTQSTPAGLGSPNPFKAGGSAAPAPPLPSPHHAKAGASAASASAGAGAAAGAAAAPWAHLSPERLLKLRRLHKLRRLLQRLPPGVHLPDNPVAAEPSEQAGTPRVRRSARSPGGGEPQPEADAIAMLASVACM